MRGSRFCIWWKAGLSQWTEKESILDPSWRRNIKAKNCLCVIGWKKIVLENVVFFQQISKKLVFPFALVNLGPEEGKVDLKGKRLRAAPVSTKYLLWV